MRGYPQALEADILFVRRFLIDTYDYFKPKEKINPTYAIVDVETNHPESDDIISFAINNPDGDIYYESKYDTPDYEDLITSLYNHLQEFDVILAWMGEDSFDLKIMDAAFKKIGLQPLTESVVVLDLIAISRKMHGREIRGNWSLDNAGKRLCGIAKSLDDDDMKMDVRDLPEEKLKIYNCVDTLIPEVIDNHLGGLEGHVILAWSLHAMLEDTIIVAAVNDIALLRAYHRAGIVLPSREFTKGKSTGKSYEAAKPDARQGVYENIVTLDLIHAYPSAVIAKNISPETKDENGKHLTPKGTRFNDGDSVFIQTLKELMVERATVKKRLKKLEKDHPDYKKLKSIDFALKTQIAAFSHGIFGWANSRMNDVETADAITAIVREIISKVKTTCDIIGKKWIYCHTDSAYVICNKEEAEATVEYINRVIRDFCEGYNVIPELEFKGYYPIGYIHSPARNVLVPEGVSIDDDEGWEESGMDFGRSETAEPVAQIEIEMIRMKLRYQDEKMMERLKQMLKELPDKTSIELALIKPLNKRISEYGKPKKDGTMGGIPFHIKAMQRAHEEYGLELKLKEKYGILPVVTDEFTGVRVKRRKRVDMAFKVDDGLPVDYKIDYETYLKTNLFGKINDLF
ncbi:MAG: hypothetical protein KJ556_21230, partial [Gammaproteobacteria bacterium]|nr:hypothetical protein [Gammaproteobacteria bacterium]